MPKIIIDDKELEVDSDITVMEAAEIAGIEIPKFCYHKRLEVAGNCRMCLVESDKSPRLVPSCCTNITDGMVVKTSSQRVSQARQSVLEFLLINHPLDCPICDEGGECDLQDGVFKYGMPKSRFHENKRTVPDKYMGPLIKTSMNRCIHCTRCIRFANDVAGIEEIAAIGRGQDMEITTYLNRALESELSGNLIDLCPVGALTAKPNAFRARSWELKHTYSVDVMDATGSNIRIDSKDGEVIRIVPKVRDDINEEWISDKARFSCDALRLQRIDRPYIRKNGKLVEISMREAIFTIAGKLRDADHEKIGVIAGTLIDVESLYIMKKLMESLGCSNIDANEFGYNFDLSKRGNYLFNSKIAGISEADLCILVGANPREVAPVLNARIGGRVRSGGMRVYRIGSPSDQTYNITELGTDINKAKSDLCALLETSSKAMIIIGDGVTSRSDSLSIQSMIYEIAKKYGVIRSDWNGFNILHNHASMIGALDIGFVPKKNSKNAKKMTELASKGEMELLYLLGADDIEIKNSTDCFIIYQGHHNDKNASKADIIIPSSAYTEKYAIYVNMEGRPSTTNKAVCSPGKAIEDWRIVSMIADAMGKKFPKDLDEVRNMISKEVPYMLKFGEIMPCDVAFENCSSNIDVGEIKQPYIDFYITNSISRASATMAKCSEIRRNLRKIS